MSIYIVSKKIALTDLIRNKVENTFIKLENYLGNNNDIYIKLDMVKRYKKVEVTIFIKNKTNLIIVKAKDYKDNLYTAIDSVYNKLYKGIRKLKTRIINKNKSSESIRFNSVDQHIDLDRNDNLIKRYKIFSFKPPESN